MRRAADDCVLDVYCTLCLWLCSRCWWCFNYITPPPTTPHTTFSASTLEHWSLERLFPWYEKESKLLHKIHWVWKLEWDRSLVGGEVRGDRESGDMGCRYCINTFIAIVKLLFAQKHNAKHVWSFVKMYKTWVETNQHLPSPFYRHISTWTLEMKITVLEWLNIPSVRFLSPTCRSSKRGSAWSHGADLEHAVLHRAMLLLKASLHIGLCILTE